MSYYETTAVLSVEFSNWDNDTGEGAEILGIEKVNGRFFLGDFDDMKKNFQEFTAGEIEDRCDRKEPPILCDGSIYFVNLFYEEGDTSVGAYPGWWFENLRLDCKA